MKKILFTFVFLVGSYAGAEQLPDSTSQMGSVPQMDSNSQMDSSSRMDAPIPQMPEAAVDKPKRNGFVSSTFGVVTPNLDQFIFAINTTYGEVIGKTDIADAGTFEATTSITGAFAEGSSLLLVSGATEINFIKNNGMNKLVPGLGISISVGHAKVKRFSGYVASFGGSLYLKAFVARQFAIVPYFSVAGTTGGISGANDFGVSDGGLELGLGVGLRRYF